jgi:hypothetical protein
MGSKQLPLIRSDMQFEAMLGPTWVQKLVSFSVPGVQVTDFVGGLGRIPNP